MTRTLADPGIQAAAKAEQRSYAALSPTELISKAHLEVQDPQRRQIIERLSQMPVSCRGGYLKAMRGRSMAAGVKAFCLECFGWVRTEIPECTARACPLYEYRPWKDD